MKWRRNKTVSKEDDRKIFSKVMLSLLILFGIIFLIMGCYALYNQWSLTTENKAVGYVISNQEKVTDNKTYYIPTYQYEVSGTQYLIQANYGTLDRLEAGTKVTVYYNSESPELGTVYEFDSKVLLIVIGAMAITLPLALYIIDSDSQKDDALAGVKAELVIALGFLYYLVASALTGNLSLIGIWQYSPAIIIFCLAYLVAGTYSLVKVIMYKRKAIK